ncbi:MAG: enoyl-CoA hydratase [Actinomycetes bacterium]
MTDLVLVSTDSGVTTVTLHRPEARNALNSALMEQLAGALTHAEADDATDVVVLTGSDPAFCAGLDLRELGSTGSNLRGGADAISLSPFAALWRMTKPVIGAVNGPCVTGGFELALACDLLVASERATFADTHARVGLLPAGGMSTFLPEAVGYRRAKEMSLTGNFLGARDAWAAGLVNHVVPHDELLPFARRLAADIAGNDQAAVRALKRLYDENAKLTGAEAVANELRTFAAWRFDPGEVERRRAGVVDRGRHQQS